MRQIASRPQFNPFGQAFPVVTPLIARVRTAQPDSPTDRPPATAGSPSFMETGS
jgi:hypothetical protein